MPTDSSNDSSKLNLNQYNSRKLPIQNDNMALHRSIAIKLDAKYFFRGMFGVLFHKYFSADLYYRQNRDILVNRREIITNG